MKIEMKMTTKRVLTGMVLLATSLLLGGCATFKAQNIRQVERHPIERNYRIVGLSAWINSPAGYSGDCWEYKEYNGTSVFGMNLGFLVDGNMPLHIIWWNDANNRSEEGIELKVDRFNEHFVRIDRVGTIIDKYEGPIRFLDIYDSFFGYDATPIKHGQFPNAIRCTGKDALHDIGAPVVPTLVNTVESMIQPKQRLVVVATPEIRNWYHFIKHADGSTKTPNLLQDTDSLVSRMSDGEYTLDLYFTETGKNPGMAIASAILCGLSLTIIPAYVDLDISLNACLTDRKGYTVWRSSCSDSWSLLIGVASIPFLFSGDHYMIPRCAPRDVMENLTRQILTQLPMTIEPSAQPVGPREIGASSH